MDLGGEGIVRLDNAEELALIAQEIGTEVTRGAAKNPEGG